MMMLHCRPRAVLPGKIHLHRTWAFPRRQQSEPAVWPWLIAESGTPASSPKRDNLLPSTTARECCWPRVRAVDPESTGFAPRICAGPRGGFWRTSDSDEFEQNGELNLLIDDVDDVAAADFTLGRQIGAVIELFFGQFLRQHFMREWNFTIRLAVVQRFFSRRSWGETWRPSSPRRVMLVCCLRHNVTPMFRL